MKLTVALLFLIIDLQFVENSQDLAKEILDCISELNINKSKINFPKDSNYLSEDIPEFNDVMGCFWQKKGYLKSDGAINYESLIKFLKNTPKRLYGNISDTGNLGLEIASDAVDGCRNITKGNTVGQTVVRTLNCVVRFVEEFVEEDR